MSLANALIAWPPIMSSPSAVQRSSKMLDLQKEQAYLYILSPAPVTVRDEPTFIGGVTPRPPARLAPASSPPQFQPHPPPPSSLPPKSMENHPSSPGAITFSNPLRSSTPRNSNSDHASRPRPARLSFNHRLRPRVVHRCAEMIPEAYEQKRRLEESALVVEDKGKRLVRDAAEVKELLFRAFGIIGNTVSVHRAYYTKFIVYFESRADRARAEQKGFIRIYHL
ncbi:hypothetical protein BS78_07G008300 [Paspalum vaginatum]|nr:hypothetical protein BS78_07G008300 [Paspalum vaginatum]